jgi:hypothetical protein
MWLYNEEWQAIRAVQIGLIQMQTILVRLHIWQPHGTSIFGEKLTCKDSLRVYIGLNIASAPYGTTTKDENGMAGVT